VAIKVELRGRLTQSPELRVTPAGVALIRCEVDCGENAGELVLSVVMAGERVRALPAMAAGLQIRAAGALRAVRGRLRSRTVQQGIEIVAEEIALDTAG
jgi:single-stranded DNA-binding protein